MANENWTVEWYRTGRGDAPILLFLADLEGAVKDEAAALLRLAATRGHRLREPHSKSLGEGLMELRGKRGVRILYIFRPGRRIVVLDGIVKKRWNIPASVLDRVRAYQRAVEAADAKKGE